MLQAGRSRVRFSLRLLDFSNCPNLSSHTVAPGSTQTLTEVRASSLRGGGGGKRRTAGA
jgi:hypothetical protein